MATARQREIAKALARLVPYAPLSETNAIRALANRDHMRALPVATAVWLSIVTHVRHELTDYHALLAEGYDRETARHFVVDDMNAVLRSWQATRFVDGDSEDTDVAMMPDRDQAE